MRILYDVSALGLGQLYPLSRGGSFRVHRHLAEGLAAHPECELLLCANHSSIAFQGAAEYLRASPALAGLPLLAPRPTGAAARARAGVRRAHRWTRALVGSNVLPPLLRSGGAYVDRAIHPPVSDASPPVDVFHSPGFPLPPRPRRGRSPQRFLTVYDLPHRRPELYGPAYRRAGEAILDSLREGDWVITSSHASRGELCEQGIVPPERVFVAPLAADRRLFHPDVRAEQIDDVRRRHGIPPGPYLLSVNNVDLRKNLHLAVRAFARLARQERADDLSLVLAGHAGTGSQKLREALDELGPLRDRVIVTGFVEDEDLAPLYAGATAFLYPSRYEGFGLPPLEAMQCGTPVITSTAASLPEVVGDAGIMVDAEDGDALCEAMLRVYRDGSLRERMREASLARAALFSWERCTEQTLAAYRTALAS
ncbi:MAG TPA: glycosyltransferase family 1 protein [Longimicrobium sp.]|nr:glycosyltransferase family 1 protein [Longimicrobium sp.]